jgi:hypothetical protein
MCSSSKNPIPLHNARFVTGHCPCAPDVRQCCAHAAQSVFISASESPRHSATNTGNFPKYRPGICATRYGCKLSISGSPTLSITDERVQMIRSPIPRSVCRAVAMRRASSTVCADSRICFGTPSSVKSATTRYGGNRHMHHPYSFASSTQVECMSCDDVV